MEQQAQSAVNFANTDPYEPFAVAVVDVLQSLDGEGGRSDETD